MTIKDLVYKILLENPETRDSDKKLIWEVWKQLGLLREVSVAKDTTGEWLFREEITKDRFMSAPSNESVRRVRQQLQRSDLLTGNKLIQPSIKIKEKRVKLSKERGASFIMGKDEVKEEWVFNPETGEYRHEM